MIMKSAKFKIIFEGLKIAYGQYRKAKEVKTENKKVRNSLFERMLAMTCGRTIYREKVRLWASSPFVRTIRVGGAVLILIVTISTTAASFRAYEILISP